MTNINCSVNCNHENNGKCTLNHISISSNLTGIGADCAYFEPRQRQGESSSILHPPDNSGQNM
jgi:hypothetical protein